VARGIYGVLKGNVVKIEEVPPGEGKDTPGGKDEDPKTKPDETDPAKLNAKRAELVKRGRELNKRADTIADRYGKQGDPELEKITESNDDIMTKAHNGTDSSKLGDFEKTLDENKSKLDELETRFNQELIDKATSQKIRAYKAAESAADKAGGKYQADLAKIAVDAETFEGQLKNGGLDTKTMKELNSALENNESKLRDIERDLGLASLPPWKGPVDYSSVPNPPSDAVGPGRDFTDSHKERLRARNRSANDGLLRSDLDGTVLDEPTQGSSNNNQAEVDHKQPKDKGGSNTSDNAQILSKGQNNAKSNK
jgi:hypothetical protein